MRHSRPRLIRKQLSIFSFLAIAAVASAGAQTTARPDTLVLGRGTLSGTWSATDGNARLVGTWTAVPDTTHVTVIGTWTLVNAQGTAIAYGGWSAAKSPSRWTGGWRANISGQPGDYSGTWTSTVALKPNARFVELFEAAAQAVIRGTWTSGGRSGAWSIRATK